MGRGVDHHAIVTVPADLPDYLGGRAKDMTGDDLATYLVNLQDFVAKVLAAVEAAA